MEEIGKALREARALRGISLTTAEDETKIRLRYLEALEQGDMEEIPGDVYVKGFLRSYANYLGLDGPALVEQYKAVRRQAGNGREGHFTSLQPIIRQAEGPGEGAARQRRPRRAADPARGAWLAKAFAFLVLAGLVLALYWWASIQLQSQPVAPAPAPQAQPETPPTQPPPPVPKPPPPPPPPPAAKPPGTEVKLLSAEGGERVYQVTAGEMSLTVSLEGGPCWVLIRSGDRELFEGTLSDGASRSFGAEREFSLRLGNPPPVKIKINEVELERLTAFNPINLRFTLKQP